MKTTAKHLMAFAISIVYILFVHFFMGIYFSTNDDRFMGELLSGAITGSFDTHLVYVNYLLALPLSLLYRITTDVSWFGILLVLFHWLSCFCILDSFYSKAKTKTDIAISTILTALLFITELYLISQISYTMTASFMAVAGYVCLLLHENKKFRFVSFILLELFALLLRDKAMLMIQPLGFAVYFGLTLKESANTLKTNIFKIVKTGVFLIGILMIGFIGNKIGYSGNDWQTYQAYNDARTTLFDYSEFPPYEEVSHILEKHGVSEIDYNAYAKYAILDYKLSLDCVEELADFMKTKEQSASLSSVLNDFKTFTFQEQYWQTNTIVILGWLCTVIFLLLSGNFRGFLPLICLLAARTVIWFYLLYEGRLPLRVSMPLFACELLLLWTIIFYYYRSKQHYVKWQKFSYITIGLIFCIVSLWSAKIQFVNFRQMNEVQKIYINGLHDVYDYCNTKSENKYILDTLSFMWYNGEAFDGSLYGKRNCIAAGCWLSNAPTLLKGNEEYLSDTKDGFYFIMFSEFEDTDEEMNHPIVKYLAKESGSTPQITDSFIASHGGMYSVIYFDGELKLNTNP